jgi:hypothetical protein
MFLTRMSLDRRTFLRGMGATVALPLLDAMIPARALLASSAGRPVPRLAFVYFPHGAIMDEWAPATAGRSLELGRILEPLAPYRSRLTVISGLENRHAYGPVHLVTPGTWLSGTSPRLRQGSGEAAPDPRGGHGDSSGGVTADQLAATHLGDNATLSSMTVASEAPAKVSAGPWQGQYDESYGTTISFRRANVPVPMEFRPRAVFDTLFQCGPAIDTSERRAPESTSVLDRVAESAARLRTRLGPSDRAVLGEYLDTVREVEQRVRTAECAAHPGQEQADTADRCKDRLALMFDLIALAFRADVTRVASLMMAAETSAMTYDHIDVPESFHGLSHHQNDPEKIEKLVRIQTFHTRMFATFVQTLAELPDGDGSILDRSLILFGSNMSNSHAHDHFPLPLAVIGGGCGTLRGGQHLRYPDHTPLSNLLLTMQQRAGVRVQSFGDCTGECAEL